MRTGAERAAGAAGGPAARSRSLERQALALRERAAGPPAAPAARSAPVRIGVARDLAFQFYYEENFARLRSAGAELVFWSPEADIELPDVDGLYFGGGYPELRAKPLAANVGVRRAVRKFVEAGGVVYGECGGLMYLAEALEDDEGVTHEMVGVLPATVHMRPRRLSLGYTTVTTMAPSSLGPAGATARGHEFHYSTLDPVPSSVPRVYRLADTRGGERAEGYQIGRALVSYAHLHFASNPELAPALVDACARRRS
jgi:cobyrinic acid a,c-diamide synthase